MSVNTADLAIAVAGIAGPEVIAVAAIWHLVRSGRVRLSAPSPAQILADRDTGENGAADEHA